MEPRSYGGSDAVARSIDLISGGRVVDSGLQALEYSSYSASLVVPRFRRVLWAGIYRPPCAVPHSVQSLHWTHRPLTTVQWQGVMVT